MIIHKHLNNICELDKEGIKSIMKLIASYKRNYEYYSWWKYFWFKVRNQIKFFKKSSLILMIWSGNSIEYVIKQYLQNVVYYLNQPAAARNFQSIFWNVGYFW